MISWSDLASGTILKDDHLSLILLEDFLEDDIAITYNIYSWEHLAR
jgi:hypothetical protein